MKYRLRPGLACCVHAQRAIFLDVPKNRYFMLAGDANRAFVELFEQGAETFDRTPGIERLLSLGVLQFDPQVGFKPSNIPKPHSELSASGQCSPSDRIAAVGAQFAAVMTLWLRPFEVVVRSTREAGNAIESEPCDPSTSRKSAGRVASAFRATRNVRPRASHCLTSSLAFYGLAIKRRLQVRLVFGVQATPFLAHSWVEMDGVVLNDDLEFISCFTPILAL